MGARKEFRWPHEWGFGQSAKTVLIAPPISTPDTTPQRLKSIPAAQPKGEPLYTIPGLPPDLTNPPAGCSFKARNRIGKPELCLSTAPPLSEIIEGHHAQNCPGCLAS